MENAERYDPFESFAEMVKANARYRDEIDRQVDTILADRDRLAAENARLREALTDMWGGWRYIQTVHGRMAGVGWDRCEEKAQAAMGCDYMTAARSLTEAQP